MQYNILTRVTSHHYRRIAYIIIFIGRNGYRTRNHIYRKKRTAYTIDRTERTAYKP